MRKTLKFTAMIALMFATTVGMAKEPKVSADTKDKSILFQLAASKQLTYVRLLDAQSQIIYSQVNRAGANLVKRFDLKELKSGTYYIEVENEIKELTYTLSLENDELVIVDKREKGKPIFRKDGDMVFLNLLNLELEEVEITVYDSIGRELFSESTEGEQLVQKVFNFEKAYSDNYTVVVKNGDGTYYEDIVVK